MPKVSEEEWNEEVMVWLTPRQILAVAMILNEVQRYAPSGFAINSELLKEARGAKGKLWEEVKPMMFDDEVERADIDPSLGPG
jgi:hypothetical protein